MSDREIEFLEAKDKLTPILNKRFHYLVKRLGTRDDILSLVEDLVALTICEALCNSMKVIHKDIRCEQLIRIKARNVWADYYKQRLNSFNHANHEPIEMDWKEDLPYAEVEGNEKLEWLFSVVDPKMSKILLNRLQGYTNREIAMMYVTTEGAIEQQIIRLKKKLKSRPQ